MKRFTRVILFVIAVIAAMSIAAVGVFGADDYQSQNFEYGRAQREHLVLLQECYVHKFPDNSQTAEQIRAETEAINGTVVYSTEISDLMVVTEDKRGEMDLAYQKGVASAMLNWIYYSHYEVLPDDTIAAVYEAQLQRISNASDISFFTTVENSDRSVESCYNILLTAIYRQKILDLRLPTDAGTPAENIITVASSNAFNTSRYIYGFSVVNEEGTDRGVLTEDESQFTLKYDETVVNLEIQRNRDKTNAQMQEIFGKLYPTEDFLTSSLLSNYHTALGSSTHTTPLAMNNLMQSTLSSLLEGLEIADKPFRNKYLAEKQAEVAEAVTEANSEAQIKVAELSAIFENYTLELYSADKKDTLVGAGEAEKTENNYDKSRSDKIDLIIKEYTDTLFDAQTDKTGIDAEYDRALDRFEWFEECARAEDRINSDFPRGNGVLSEVEALLAATDGAIKKGERTEGDSFEARLSSDLEALSELITDAEVLQFKADNAEIIGALAVTPDNRPLLREAFADADLLSKEAKVKLSQVLDDLTEKYRAQGREEIAAALGSGEDRDTLKAELLLELAKVELNAEGYTDFADRHDAISAKAAVLDGLLDVYENEYNALSPEFFTEKARDILDTACDKIIAEGNEEATRDGAIAELYRLAALEKINKEAKGRTDIDGVSELLDRAKEEVRALSSKADTDKLAEDKIAELYELYRLDAVRNASGDLEAEAEKLKGTVNGYKYITPEEKQTYIDRIAALVETAKADISSAPDAEGAGEEYKKALSDLAAIGTAADKDERAACLADAKDKINSCYGKREDYSSENYATILEHINSYTARLDKASGVPEYEALRDEAIGKILAVEDKLEEAKRLGGDRLLAEYNALLQREHCYSEEALASLESIYNDSLSGMDGYVSVAEVAALNAYIDERIALMRGVRLDRLYTSDGLLFGDFNPEAPKDYDPEAGEYFGAVTSKGGISYDMTLEIKYSPSTDVLEIIQRAARKKKISLSDGSLPERDILRRLARCRIIASADISLGAEVVQGKKYTLSLLLPKGTDMNEVIGVVFVRDDGSVEFIEVKEGECKVDFVTDHFSRFYVVSRGQVNLLPWIICLSILLLCELVIIAILLLRRRRRRNEAVLYSVAVPLLLTVKYTPVGGKAIVIVLGTAVAALAVVIGYLCYLEVKEARKKKPAVEEKKEEPVPVAVAADAAVAEKERGELIAFEPVAEVTVTEADELISDSEVLEIQEEMNLYIDTEVYHGLKKAEINIDTIGEMFAEGDVVTLNSLKEKKLVGAKVGHVKVLARGSLKKPLTVVAQDFSLAAVKMIVVTGGSAIVTHESAEREAQRKKR